jgi:hypothetical protein
MPERSTRYPQRASKLKTGSPRTANTPTLLPVSDMTGGVDLRRSPTLLHQSRSRTSLNASLGEPGAWTVRDGYSAASTATFGSNITGGERIYLAGNVFSLVAADGEVFRPTDAWVKGAAVHSTISTGNQTYFTYDRDLVAVVDGANRPRFSTNGTDWYLMGTDACSSGPSLATASTGGLTSGTYSVAFSFKHRGTAHESSISPESTVRLATSSGSITATASGSTDPKVDAIVWYARHLTPDLESVLRKVSSGSSLAVVINSSAWTAASPAPLNNSVPVVARYATVWKNRWWWLDATLKNRIHFSEVFQPQSQPSDYYIDIPFERGDDASAIHPIGDTLMVFGQAGIYLIIGQTSLDFEVRPSQGADSGAYGPRAVANIEQSIAHMSSDDISSNDGASDRSLGFDITPALRDIARNGTGQANVAAYYDAQNKELRVSVPRVYPTAARGEWVLNLNRTRENEGAPAWTTTDRDIAFYMPWGGNEPTPGNRGRLFTVPSTGGFVYEENIVGGGANSSALTATYEGPALNLGTARARVAGTHVEFEPHAGSFSVELVADGISQGSLAVDIGAGLATYGTSVYNTGTYSGAGRLKRFIHHPLSADGHSFVLKGTYTGTEPFRWFGYSHVIVPESMPRRVY